MTVTILPGTVPTSVPAIPSKSVAHRMFLCGALSEKPSQILCRGMNQDIAATIRCLKALGASISESAPGVWEVRPIPRNSLPEAATLNCGESGSTLRFLLPVAGALGVTANFHSAGRLIRRPLHPLVRELESHGCRIFYHPEGNLIQISGKLRGGDFSLPGDVSSQFITGLLFVLPLLKEESNLTVTGELESEGYVALTRETIRLFSEGVRQVEGDWSNAAPWLCMGALSKHPVTVTGLNPNSKQGDREICRILQGMGAEVQWKEDAVTVHPAPLRPVTVDARQIPDLVPVLAATMAGIPGESHITNAARLRLKESDRIKTTAALLRGLGGQVTEAEDSLHIFGRGHLPGGMADAHNDHRIAMAAAVAAQISQNSVTLTGAEAVSKSYPNFWEVLL